ncbi:energy-coupled thiamine transporter ThiT [Mariniplasma anaerobium]|uniref:Thiamine transporter ThiT n=1 Tax=Mariniplasma anaerobium TaxID=2735436 RepID=A0A7U9TKM1_9MOLU|nr:energy-coupled thiamine transporter ThiT [Mariniplasma anaerobium]BCR35959.1 thiamine transporter ThiT [Mariniplasma anaerobium]
MNQKSETRKMIATINLLAIAIILDVLINAIPVLNLSMPFGGKFFGISMLPIVMIGLMFGLKYGLISGFIYAMYNFGIDYIIYIEALKSTLEAWTGESWGAFKIFMLILFDYIIPFMAFGLSGLFKEGFKTKAKFIYAFVTVSIVRLISSTISGVILWSSSITYAVDQVEQGEANQNIATQLFSFVGNKIWLYSLGYNLIYIVSTLIVTLIIGLLSFKRLQAITQDYAI